MMPAVTEPPRPNGLPAGRAPNRRPRPGANRRRAPRAAGSDACTLIRATSVNSSVPITRAGSCVPSVSETTDPVRMTHDVIVGDDQPRRIDDEARAGPHRLFAPVAEAAAKFAAERGIPQFRVAARQAHRRR